jgi:hypothetical protein
VRRGGVCPCVAQRTEPGALFSDAAKDIEKVSGRSGKPIQTGHYNNVTTLDILEQPLELAAIGACASYLFPKYLGAAGSLKLSQLRIKGLAICTHPRIPKFGHRNDLQLRTYIMHTISPDFMRSSILCIIHDLRTSYGGAATVEQRHSLGANAPYKKAPDFKLNRISIDVF